MATRIPGEPAAGTPYSGGVDATDLDSAQTLTNNFSSDALDSSMRIGEEDNALVCDLTGFRISIREGLRETWNGWMVRKASWEARHPQDAVRSRSESGQNGSPRPEQDDQFIADLYPGGVSASDL